MHLLCQCLERCFHRDSQQRWCGMKNEPVFFFAFWVVRPWGVIWCRFTQAGQFPSQTVEEG